MYFIVWSTFMIAFSICHVTQAASLLCFRRTTDDYIKKPLEDAPLFYTDPSLSEYFNHDKTTTCYTTGYTATFDNNTRSVIQRFLDLNDRNVCYLDWSNEANTYLNPLQPIPGAFNMRAFLFNYPVVAGFARQFGNQMGDAFNEMADAGLDLSTVELVGHSVGAHLWAYSGRKTNKGIGRIVGLDPAKAFTEGIVITEPLGPECAKFVLGLHTDWNRYGIDKTVGDIDAWANYGYYSAHSAQPGCAENAIFNTIESYCSHLESWKILREALANPNNFLMSRADSYAEWANNVQQNSTYFGENINTQLSGNFYFCTNGEPVYGKGADGINPDLCAK